MSPNYDKPFDAFIWPKRCDWSVFTEAPNDQIAVSDGDQLTTIVTVAEGAAISLVRRQQTREETRHVLARLRVENYKLVGFRLQKAYSETTVYRSATNHLCNPYSARSWRVTNARNFGHEIRVNLAPQLAVSAPNFDAAVETAGQKHCVVLLVHNERHTRDRRFVRVFVLVKQVQRLATNNNLVHLPPIIYNLKFYLSSPPGVLFLILTL